MPRHGVVCVASPGAVWLPRAIWSVLQRRHRDLRPHGRATGRFVRTAEGEFFEVHEPLPEHERWALVQHETPKPLELRATVDGNGVRRRGTRAERLRARLSRFYFADSVHAVTPAELAAAHHDGTAHEALAPAQEWVGQLHGGADERPETDAYASHEPEHEVDPDPKVTR